MYRAKVSSGARPISRATASLKCASLPVRTMAAGPSSTSTASLPLMCSNHCLSFGGIQRYKPQYCPFK